MKKGNLWKEKKEYVIERFTTKFGLIDFFVGTAIWGFLIVKYENDVFNYFMDAFKNVGNELLQQYLTYLLLGITFTIIGLVISFSIVYILKEGLKK